MTGNYKIKGVIGVFKEGSTGAKPEWAPPGQSVREVSSYSDSDTSRLCGIHELNVCSQVMDGWTRGKMC